MAVLGIDLGGTKLALAVFSDAGEPRQRDTAALAERRGAEVGALIVERAAALVHTNLADDPVRAVGVAVPGIYHSQTGRVWAPNIAGWDDYPLREELRAALDVPIAIDSDRACYVLGDAWRGAARGCRNAVFLAVGTGIGAGVLVDGRVLRGQRDIAGAVGWFALDRPHRPEYAGCGGFEHDASGPGIVRVVRELLRDTPAYTGPLRNRDPTTLTTADVFSADAAGDPLAARAVANAVELWGMAVANLVSVFDPDVVVLGGGVFGPAARYLDHIREEALRWAQPISMPQVRLAVTPLGGEAGLYGAGHLALRALHPT